ncbi:MAG: hypothetical protein ABJN21_03995 [Paracoccaceae bacterium]
MLVGVAVQTIITAAVGNRTTRREVLAALDAQAPNQDFQFAAGATGAAYFADENDEIWVDYVADLGDGFNATHSIAWLIGRDYLGLSKEEARTAQPIPPSEMAEVPRSEFADFEHVLPGGAITIFGGDLVYPLASVQNYEDRTVGPYYAARPWQTVAGKLTGRALYSIPGNHDWYDGLASYVRRFCQRGRWLGAWQIQQRRSYFAIDLEHGCSIWGLDLAMSDDFDAAQFDYFWEKAQQLRPHEQVILCTAKPVWNYEVKPSDEATNVAWSTIQLVRKWVEANGTARVVAFVSGDQHHYLRYQEDNQPKDEAVHFITCGGGGAFMSGTDAAPEKLSFDSGETPRNRKRFPSEDESKSMRSGVFKMFWRHKRFCLALSAIMFTLVWLLQSASRALLGNIEVSSAIVVPVDKTFLSSLEFGLWEFAKTVAKTLVFAPTHLLVVLLVAGGFVMFAHSSRGPNTQNFASYLAGVIHFLAQFSTAIGLAYLALSIFDALETGFWVFVVLLPLLTLGLGWVAHGLVLSAYIWLSNLMLGLHGQEIFSAQSIEGYKSFLRIRINKDGLTIYPIGLKEIVRDWKTRDEAETPDKFMENALMRLGLTSQTLDVPDGATNLLRPGSPIEPQLIEEPIEITRKQGKMA